MSFSKSGNPVLQEKMFQNTIFIPGEDAMTKRGALNKFFFLFLLVMAAASFTWNAFSQGKDVFPWMIGAAIGGFVVALVIIFKKEWSAYLAPAYGLLEGVFVGGISAVCNNAFHEVAPGIVMQAVGLTFGVVIAMYLLYHFRIIKATQKVKSMVFTATVGVAIFYLIAIILHMFAIDMPFIHEGSKSGVFFCFMIVAIAAMNLIIDFDVIDQCADAGAPKYMEWYCAFGLLVTIVWLYTEILRLLSEIGRR
jgi:uncharacterized YccA/Bax inhibitor family protein